jgi:glycosyltransferase involved in cell wall biosynthesis
MLTVMLATRDRADILARTLEAMTRLRPPEGGWRLLAVDNGSADRTPEVLARFAAALPMTVLRCARPGVSAALNAALPHIEGDLAIRADDDVLVAPGWLAAFRAAADRHPEATLLGGAVEADWPHPPPAWLWTDPRALGMLFALTDPPDGPCEPADVYGPHWAVRSAVFAAGMRLDETVGPDASKACYAMGNESELFGRLAKAGLRARHVAAARVRHIIRPEQLTEAWILRRAFNCGLGAGPLPRPVRRPAYAAAARACRRLPPSRMRTRIMLTDRLLAGMAASGRTPR